ncbi:hypothetical protein OROGR_015961 [Orobanche gracilis]
MGDQIAKGEDLEKKAEKKLTGWGIFSSKYEDAIDLFDKAANAFKLAKSFAQGDQAGAVYIKLANCHLKLESKHEAASAYADAAHSFKKTNIKNKGNRVNIVPGAVCKLVPGDWKIYCDMEIAELYEQEPNLEQAIVYYEKAADLFLSEEVTSSANQCKQKIADYSAQLKQYQKAVEIYEDIARHSLNNNLLKYGVKGHLLNAGICQLCKGDVVAINNALEKYQELDPTFSGTREYKLLADLAAAVDEEDVAKFTAAVKEFDSMTHLDSSKTTLLLRVKEALRAKELEDEDLT